MLRPVPFIILPVAIPLACLLAATPLSATGMSPRIALRTSAEVTAARLTLNDVADLSAPDLATLRRLMALPLAGAPRAGETVMLSRAEVARQLARWHEMTEGMEWAGAPAVAVARPLHLVNGMSVQQAARGAVEAALAMLGVPVQWTALHASAQPMDLRLEGVRATEVTLRPRTPFISSSAAPYALVWVDVLAGERVARSMPVRFTLEATRPVPNVAARDGSNRFSAAPAARLGTVALASAQVARSVSASAPIPAAANARPLLIGKGDAIRVRTHRGRLSIERPALALDGGGAGEPVTVRMASNASPILARVVARGLAEVSVP